MISDLDSKIANDAPPLRRTRSSEHPRLPLRRSRRHGVRIFAGLELIEPDIVSVSDWRVEIEPELRLCPTETAAFGAVGRLTFRGYDLGCAATVTVRLHCRYTWCR